MAISLEPVPFLEAIAMMRRRGIKPSEIYYSKEFQRILRDYAFSVAGMSNAAQLQNVLDSLTETLKTGETFDTWKEKIAAEKYAVAALPESRLDIIFRTNVMSQYNSGRLNNAIKFQKQFPFVLISAIMDDRVRKKHAAFNGIVTQINSPTFQAWMNRDMYRCRCTFITLTDRTAKQWIAEDKARLKANPDLAKERAATAKEFGKLPVDKLKESAEIYKGTPFEKYVNSLI